MYKVSGGGESGRESGGVEDNIEVLPLPSFFPALSLDVTVDENRVTLTQTLHLDNRETYFVLC